MATDRFFSTAGIVAIPTGHRVEVTVFALKGFWGAPKPRPYDPLIKNLETGVVYGRTWHFTDENPSADQVPFEVRRDLVVAELVVGRVRACRIFRGKLPDMGTANWITNLVVSFDPGGLAAPFAPDPGR